MKNGRDLLSVIGEVMKVAGAVGETMKPCSPGNRELLVLSPEHVQLIVQDGFTKEKTKAFLFEKSRVPMDLLKLRTSANPAKLKGEFEGCFKGWETWESIPLVARPEDIAIVVSGGPGKHSVYMSTNGYAPVTKEIKK